MLSRFTGRRQPQELPCAITLVLACLVLVAPGCGVPDTQPFADATAQLRDGIHTVGAVTVERVKGDDEPIDSDQPPAPGDPDYPTWEVQQLWEVRLAAAQALVRYADALAAITASARRAGSTADELGSAIQEISRGFSAVSAPSDQVVALATKLVEIAVNVKAAHDLDDAISKAHPAVEGIAALLLEDLDDLLLRYQTAHRDELRRRFLKGETAYSREYLAITTRRSKAEEEVNRLWSERSEAGFDTAAGRELVEDLQAAEELLARLVARETPYRADYLALVREREDVEEIFRKTKQAVHTWLATHGDLAEAVRRNRQPNWRELLSTARELHVLIERLDEDDRVPATTEVSLD
jgi:hypothetical protein